MKKQEDDQRNGNVSSKAMSGESHIFFRVLSLLLVAILSFIAGVFWDRLSNPAVDSNFTAELQQKKSDEIQKTLEHFSNPGIFDGIVNYDKLMETDPETSRLNLAEILTQKNKRTQAVAAINPGRELTDGKEAFRDDDNLKSQAANTPAQKQHVTSELAGHFMIQLAAFSRRTSADQMLEELLEKEQPAYVESFRNNRGEMLYKVRVGKYETRLEAEATLKKLKQAGFNGFIVGRQSQR